MKEFYLKATMPKMLKEIKVAYLETTGKHPNHGQPAYPGTRLHRASETEEEVKSTEYQSIMGKLMYYMAKVAP